MTLDAYTFRLDLPGASDPLGFAVLAPAARYGSILWAGHTRPVRRHGSPKQWLGVEREARTLALGTLDQGSAIYGVLVALGSGVRLSYVTGRPIVTTDPLQVGAALDALLLEFQRPANR